MRTLLAVPGTVITDFCAHTSRFAGFSCRHSGVLRCSISPTNFSNSLPDTIASTCPCPDGASWQADGRQPTAAFIATVYKRLTMLSTNAHVKELCRHAALTSAGLALDLNARGMMCTRARSS
eukprot:1191234-Amphidinium_carterae.1